MSLLASRGGEAHVVAHKSQREFTSNDKVTADKKRTCNETTVHTIPNSPNATKFYKTLKTKSAFKRHCCIKSKRTVYNSNRHMEFVQTTSRFQNSEAAIGPSFRSFRSTIHSYHCPELPQRSFIRSSPLRNITHNSSTPIVYRSYNDEDKWSAVSSRPNLQSNFKNLSKIFRSKNVTKRRQSEETSKRDYSFRKESYAPTSQPYRTTHGQLIKHEKKNIYALPFSPCTHQNKLITSIGDPVHNVYRVTLPPHLKPVLRPILRLCEQNTKNWETNMYSLTKQDIALRNIPHAYQMALPIVVFTKHILKLLYTTCERNDQQRKLYRDINSNQYNDIITMDQNQPHVLKYSVSDRHTGVDLHYDNCDYTVNLMMSSRNEYDGGGTFFPALNQVITLNPGDFLVHPGSLIHSGMNITRGSRYLMLMFAKVKK